MKITKVEPFHVVWNPHRRSAWVRITIDDGRSGLGEASPMGQGSAALEVVRSSFAKMLVGADPLDHRVLQDRLFHHHIKQGPDGVFAAALAAIDIALWDLKGQILDRPVYALLGGAWRTKLPFYASIGHNAHRSADEICRAIETWLEHKPALIKIRFDPDKTTRDADLAGDVAKARAVRRFVGEAMPLAFDANNGYSAQGAIRVGRELEDLGYAWFEEPVPHYQVESIEKVANSLDIPVAAGEQEYTLQGVKRLIDAGVSIVQPDIVKTGGFTGMSDMASLVRTFGVDLLPHQTQPSLGHVANLHLMATLLHCHYPAELNELPGSQAEVFHNLPRPVDGLYELPDAPGLGLKVNEDELNKRLERWTGSGIP